MAGGRGFAGEVGIIVLGVLLALGAQQAAEWFDRRDQATQAYAALGEELAAMAVSADERIRIFRCVERRLDEVAAIVDAADASGRLPPLGELGMPPNRPWITGTWQGVESGTLANYLPLERRATYAALYSDVAKLHARTEAESGWWTEIQQLSGPGRRFDAGDARATRVAIGQARFTNRYIGLVSAQFLEQLRTVPGLPVVSEAEIASWMRPLAQRPLCRPIPREGAPHYGQAPLREVIPAMVRQPGDAGPPPPPPYPDQ